MIVKKTTIIKYVCDRCGKEFTGHSGALITLNERARYNYSHLDLCQDCSYKFEKFMKANNE